MKELEEHIVKQANIIISLEEERDKLKRELANLKAIIMEEMTELDFEDLDSF